MRSAAPKSDNRIVVKPLPNRPAVLSCGQYELQGLLGTAATDHQSRAQRSTSRGFERVAADQTAGGIGAAKCIRLSKIDQITLPVGWLLSSR